MNIHLNQEQVSQIAQALWGISHAFEYISGAIVFSAIMRAVFNK